jgi:NAD(P)-dependent dehydrogenase (short-subunit alcohol dehydrogenase family)
VSVPDFCPWVSPFFWKERDSWKQFSDGENIITAEQASQVTQIYNTDGRHPKTRNGLESAIMTDQPLENKTVLITGAARRVGRLFALACARAGADLLIHHAHSEADAETLRNEIQSLGREARIYQADLSDSFRAGDLIPLINRSTPVHHLINNAAIFESLTFDTTSLTEWNKHFALNLTAPFLLSQAFARQAGEGARIVNILDWRALRPGADHFPYTISKSALAALTQSLAVALAPKIVVNGLALGAILPPSDGDAVPDITRHIPMKRWAHEDEAEQALLFLLTCPAYVTGEIIHVDGGRHLV